MFSNDYEKYKGIVITDVDGCLTDGNVGYSDWAVFRNFNVIDGHGFQLLKENGFLVIMISGEDDVSISKRAHKLGVKFSGGVKDKRKYIYNLLLTTGKSIEDFYFLGDDYLDLLALDVVGYFYTPKNSLIHKRFKDKYNVLESEGGKGAFRDFAEIVLELNGINLFSKLDNE
jgi:3-deoxy-D-manno-octulosonate 8-phosphate phosphatase (KDO 8-P phosphatase)